MRLLAKRISSLGLPGILVAVLASGIIAVSVVRDSVPRLFLRNQEKPDAPLVSRWIAAIEKGDMKEALLLAEKIAFPVRTEVPDSDYMQTVLDSNLSTSTITESFNKYDFMRWDDALEVQKTFKVPDQVSHEAIPGNILEKLKSMVQLDPEGQENPAPSLSLKAILTRGHGDAEEIRRLFCEAAYQNGFETMAVNAYLPDRSICERFCEIRKDGKVWTVLPHRNMVIEGRSVRDLQRGSKELAKLLPDKSSLETMTLIYALPAEFQDYRTVNQRLAPLCGEFSGSPIFGEAPRSRIDKFLLHYKDTGPPGIFTYWNYPFSVLLAEEDLPSRFRLHPGSQKSFPEK